MPRLLRIAVYLLGAWPCGICSPPAVVSGGFTFSHEDVLGTPLEHRSRADDVGAAGRAGDRVLHQRMRTAPLALAEGPEPPIPGGRGDEAKIDTGAPAAPPGAPWGNESELVVNFEINQPDAEGGRYRRPFVAIWVEDKDGFPVRNLMLWVSLGGPGPWEWLKDMKRWHRSDQVRKRVDKRDMVLTISRPTRPPGKYSVIWDGKDDHGRLVDRGEYTLCIDAAREHGTYQDIRTHMTIDDRPFRSQLEGGIEIKSASIEYRRKPPAR
jgi:FAD:protein FMN transferase